MGQYKVYDKDNRHVANVSWYLYDFPSNCGYQVLSDVYVSGPHGQGLKDKKLLSSIHRLSLKEVYEELEGVCIVASDIVSRDYATTYGFMVENKMLVGVSVVGNHSSKDRRYRTRMGMLRRSDIPKLLKRPVPIEGLVLKEFL